MIGVLADQNGRFRKDGQGIQSWHASQRMARIRIASQRAGVMRAEWQDLRTLPEILGDLCAL